MCDKKGSMRCILTAENSYPFEDVCTIYRSTFGDLCATEAHWLGTETNKKHSPESKIRLNEIDSTPIDDRQRAPASSRRLFQDANTLEIFRVHAAQIQCNYSHNHVRKQDPSMGVRRGNVGRGCVVWCQRYLEREGSSPSEGGRGGGMRMGQKGKGVHISTCAYDAGAHVGNVFVSVHPRMQEH